MTAENGQKVYDRVKTQTRRLTGLDYPNSAPDEFVLQQQVGDKFFFARKDTNVGGVVTCPYRVGERRYIREPHYLYGRWKRGGQTKTGKVKYRFVADRTKGACYPNNPPPRVCTRKSVVGWFRRPGMFMFEWAARSIVEIVEVRIQRVQEISEEDAIAEGIERIGGSFSCTPWKNYRIGQPGEMSMHCSAPARSFMTLWESIHGPGAWGRNDWVAAVTMRRVTF